MHSRSCVLLFLCLWGSSDINHHQLTTKLTTKLILSTTSLPVVEAHTPDTHTYLTPCLK